MYQAIKEIVPDAALTLFTGDIVDHAVWNTSEPYNVKQSECPALLRIQPYTMN